MQHLQASLGSFGTEVLRLSVWLLLLTLFLVPLERLFPVRPSRFFRKSVGVDLAYYYLNNLLLKVILVAPMAVIAWGLHQVVPTGLQTWSAGLSLWMRVAAALVVGELGFYWGHRWTHQSAVLWRFHAVHHSAEQIDWLVNTRAHPVDIVFVRLCGLIPMYALGLATPLRGETIDVVPVVILLFASLWGFFIHANVRVRFGWLGQLVSTPAFHHWHHTNDEHVNKNYASMLPFIDKLFGTLYMPKQWPSKYGTDGHVAPGLPAQLLNPLLPERKGRPTNIPASQPE